LNHLKGVVAAVGGAGRELAPGLKGGKIEPQEKRSKITFFAITRGTSTLHYSHQDNLNARSSQINISATTTIAAPITASTIGKLLPGLPAVVALGVVPVVAVPEGVANERLPPIAVVAVDPAADGVIGVGAKEVSEGDSVKELMATPDDDVRMVLMLDGLLPPLPPPLPAQAALVEP
jgi:hypothetical protein